jgi:hypothetical protein
VDGLETAAIGGLRWIDVDVAVSGLRLVVLLSFSASASMSLPVSIRKSRAVLSFMSVSISVLI